MLSLCLLLLPGLASAFSLRGHLPRVGDQALRTFAQVWSGFYQISTLFYNQPFFISSIVIVDTKMHIQYWHFLFLRQGPSQLLSNYDGEARKAEAEEGFKMKMRMPKKRGSVVDGRLVRNFHNV